MGAADLVPELLLLLLLLCTVRANVLTGLEPGDHAHHNDHAHHHNDHAHHHDDHAHHHDDHPHHDDHAHHHDDHAHHDDRASPPDYPLATGREAIEASARINELFLAIQDDQIQLPWDMPAMKDVPTFFSFSCVNRIQGYYADVDFGCQVYHVCRDHLPVASFLCPNGTVFNQAVFTCDWWFNVDCPLAPTLYHLNQHLYKEEDEVHVARQETVGQVKSSLHETVGQVKSSVHETAGQIKSSVHETAGQVKSSLHETAGQVKPSLHETAGQVKSSVHETAGQVKSNLHETVGQVKSNLQETIDQEETFQQDTVSEIKTFLQEGADQDKTFLQETKGQDEVSLQETTKFLRETVDQEDKFFQQETVGQGTISNQKETVEQAKPNFPTNEPLPNFLRVLQVLSVPDETAESSDNVEALAFPLVHEFVIPVPPSTKSNHNLNQIASDYHLPSEQHLPPTNGYLPPLNGYLPPANEYLPPADENFSPIF